MDNMDNMDNSDPKELTISTQIEKTILINIFIYII